MKKFTKICLAVSLFLIIMGGTLCIIGTAAGGWWLAREAGKSNSWVRLAWSIPANYGWHHLGIWEDYEDFGSTETKTVDTATDYGYVAEDGTYRELPSAGYGSMPRDYEDTGIHASDVKELQIEIAAAGLYLLESDSDSFGIMIEGQGDYQYYENKGTFYLEGNMDSYGLWEQYSGFDGETVYLYLPKGLRLKEADIEVGGGLVEITALSADEINLTTGAGEITADALECASLDVETGAGEIFLYQVIAQELDVEIGMGSVYLQGDISRKVNVECSMGNVELTLSGKESDYNYEIECSMGDIEVGSRSYSSLGHTSHTDNGASKECSLECSMGNIDIIFTEG